MANTLELILFWYKEAFKKVLIKLIIISGVRERRGFKVDPKE